MAETTPAEYQNQILLDQISLNARQHAVQIADMSLKHAVQIQDIREELAQAQAQLGEALTKLAEKLNENSEEVDNPEGGPEDEPVQE